MSVQKMIYWRKDRKPNKEGEYPANVHLLVGYNRGSVADYLKMSTDLRNTFEQATIEEIHCGSVIRSDSVDGFSIITWDAYIPKKKYPGWSQTNESPEYNWT